MVLLDVSSPPAKPDRASSEITPEMVTAVLASYRGFDTLGEVTVIFTAGMGVLVLLGSATRRRRKAPTSAKEDSA